MPPGYKTVGIAEGSRIPKNKRKSQSLIGFLRRSIAPHRDFMAMCGTLQARDIYLQAIAASIARRSADRGRRRMCGLTGRLIILDVEGTLIDCVPQSLICWREAFAAP